MVAWTRGGMMKVKKNGGIVDMLELELTAFTDELHVEREKSLKLQWPFPELGRLEKVQA